ncbi:MAG: hypothetical protein WC455_07145 [Dehalococcoidia bacterium]|jgi:hypothetical protein
MKNFIKKTRPKTREDIKEAIQGLELQINYEISIGKRDNIDYYKGQIKRFKAKLDEMH